MHDLSELPIELAEASAENHNYIRSTWLMSNRKSRWCEGVSSELYYSGHGRIVNQLIMDAYIVVARWREFPEQLYGWICYDKDQSKRIIHYCYVGAKYRRLGIGDALLRLAIGSQEAKDITATHYSQVVDELPGEKLKVTYDPYLLFQLMETTHEDF